MKKQSFLFSLLVLVVFVVADNLNTLFSFKAIAPDNYYFANILWVLIQLALPVALLVYWHGPRRLLNSLGMDKGFLQGLGLAFLFALPMLLGYGGYAGFESNTSMKKIYWGILLAPLFEEIFFRGFLFGQLYRFGGWRFIPAALVNALIFGAMHLYQANDLMSAFGVMGVTTLGGVFFAWLYIEWNNNLWIPIFLHLFMNAWWILFSAGANAAGGWYANVFRVMTIAAAVVVTIWWKRQEEANSSMASVELT